MAFVGTLPAETVDYIVDLNTQTTWSIGTDNIPTQVEIVNSGSGPVLIGAVTSTESFGNTVTVAANSTGYVAVSAVGNSDLFVGAQGLEQAGQCIITPGIEI